MSDGGGSPPPVDAESPKAREQDDAAPGSVAVLPASEETVVEPVPPASATAQADVPASEVEPATPMPKDAAATPATAAVAAAAAGSGDAVALVAAATAADAVTTPSDGSATIDNIGSANAASAEAAVVAPEREQRASSGGASPATSPSPDAAADGCGSVGAAKPSRQAPVAAKAEAESQAILDEFSDLALFQAKALTPGKVVLHSVAKEIADRHREIAHRCMLDGERKTIIAHLQAFLMNDRVLKALKQKRPPHQTSKPAVLERSAFELHVVWSPHLDDRAMDPLHYEICWGFRFTGAWSKCMCTAPRHVVTDLKPGTNYQVKVRAYNSHGFGPYSEMATISTAKPDNSGGGGGRSSSARRLQAAAAAAKKPSIFGIFKAIPAGYEELVNSIIRPPRGSYDLEELGAPKFRIDRRIFHRSDFVVHNGRGLRLQCSHWEPIPKQRRSPKLPCLIYLHGNCGCRADAVECLEEALTHGFTLLSCDLSGSGKSEGEYISLGYHEKDDVRALIRYAREKRDADGIYLWGRSMGAVTSLLVAAECGRDLIKGMVLDSPFEDLWALAQELVSNTEIKIPSFAIGMVRMMIRNSVQKRADFNIDALSPIKLMPDCNVPALFAAGVDDAFVGSHHGENLFNAHGGLRCRQFVRFPGDHNSIREKWFLDRAMVFLQTGRPVPDMPYNVPSASEAAATKQLEQQEATQAARSSPQAMRSSATARRNERSAGGGGGLGAPSGAPASTDILNVTAVLSKMQNANEREYVVAAPQAVGSGAGSGTGAAL